MREAERQEFAALLSGILDVYGARATSAGLSVWWAALRRFPLDLVVDALTAHVQDPSSGKFTPKPADVIAKLYAMDGRPGPEEAWSMIPRDEARSVVWTEEMAAAYGAAIPLLTERDQVAARMAFVERYRALVEASRASGRPAKWMPSLGTDASDCERALIEAQSKGRLSAAHVAGLLPHRDSPASVLALIQRKHAESLPAPGGAVSEPAKDLDEFEAVAE